MSDTVRLAGWWWAPCYRLGRWMDGSPRVNAPWSEAEVALLMRLVKEQGLGDWQKKADMWQQEGGEERTAKSIEGKW